MPKLGRLVLVVFMALFGIAASIALIVTHASSPTSSLEPENGVVSGSAKVINDSNASGGQAILFKGYSIVFDSNRTGNYEVYQANGGAVTQLTSDTTYDSWWPKTSPDGMKMIFYRTLKGVHDSDYTKTSLWAADIDGSNVHELIPNGGYGWVFQGHGEWSPDGQHLIMMGGPSGQLYITDNEGKNPAQIAVSGQPGLLSDPSYSPDGTKVLYAFQRHVWVVNSIGGVPTQLTSDTNADYDPYYSPDGGQIALLTHTSTNVATDWSIRLMNANGSNLHFIINDGNINSKPAWDPKGNRIYFHRHPTGAGTGFFGLWQIYPDGSNLNAINVGAGSNEYPVLMD